MGEGGEPGQTLFRSLVNFGGRPGPDFCMIEELADTQCKGRFRSESGLLCVLLVRSLRVPALLCSFSSKIIPISPVSSMRVFVFLTLDRVHRVLVRGPCCVYGDSLSSLLNPTF